MLDREKVIKGLEHCSSSDGCRGCPYSKSENGHVCSFNCIHDALALLKEQEGVEPIFDCEEPILQIGQFHCGNCNHSFGISHYRYCPYCGRPVKWKGE